MKKLLTVVLVLLTAAAVITQISCRRQDSSGGQQQTKVFRLACNQPDGYPTVVGAKAFADYVDRASNGAMKIEVYANAVLGQERETIEMTQAGIIDFIRVGTNPLTSINPQMAALSMPFLYRNREHMFAVLDGPIGDEMLQSLQRQNLLGLAWLDAGFRNFYNSQREIKTPADMRGMRIRVQDSALMMGMVSSLGASPTPMAFGEVYTGIQNRVIDGAENNWPSYLTTGHYEVARFFTVNQHMSSPEMFLINTGVWNSLNDAQKGIIKAGAQEGAKVQRAEWLRQEREYEQQARAAGCTITELTPAQHQQFVDALMPLYDQPEYAQYSDLIRRIRAVQ